MAGKFRFSFGPWNIHEGGDPFGPSVRKSFSFRQKLELYKELGFDGVQFHDDDVVDAKLPHVQMVKGAKRVKKMFDDCGLEAEFVAPRLWEDPRTIDGGFTSNDPKCRKYALARSKRTIDIANLLGTNRLVLWPAREGTYLRESKDPKVSADRFVEYADALLEYDPDIRILGEMKPNEPMDSSFCPTTGHFLAIAYRSSDPDRVGVLIESAHTILAGLDPSEEMGFALSCGKLWGVHLNDQNGLKFDEDRAFGSINLRRAFNQVYLLDKYDFGKNGEYVGLDVKALRTQKREVSTKHLANSREFFLSLLKVARSIDAAKWQNCIDQRDYEALDALIVEALMGA